MIKTLIELFDECQIENVITALRFKPEKIVYVGYKNVMTKKRKTDLVNFLKEKLPDTEIDYEVVGRYDYEKIEEKLTYIAETNEDCCFDITGGKELVLAAIGAVSAQKNIPVVQINIKTGELARVCRCESIPDTEAPSLTISEIISLNGGAVMGNDNSFKWNIDGEFRRDVETIWNICRENCALWNRQAWVFAHFQRFGRLDHNQHISVNLKQINDAGADTYQDKKIIDRLINKGLIKNYKLDGDTLSFTYKNDQVRRCIIKAGNILELYAYTLLHEIEARDKGYYDDIEMGVYIDWDGVIHRGADNEYDTFNEIDIMVMRDAVPVFISCKNGEVKKEALYELDTVASQFGGGYSKKVILTTYISHSASSRRFILQRAKDMGIEIIDGVDRLPNDEFMQTLRRTVK